MFEENERKWAQRVFGDAQLGDRRRTKRLVSVGAALAANPGLSLEGAFRDDSSGAQGAQRLVRNETVSPEAVFESGAKATALLAASCPGLLLAVEDTTTLGYAHGVSQELGDLGAAGASKRRGFWVHSVLLWSLETKSLLGLIEQQRWCRREERGKRHRRRQRPYEEKESSKWSLASRRLRERLDVETRSRVISVCDRESDVWEYLVDKSLQGERFVTRLSWDRRVTDSATRRVLETLESAAVLGFQTVGIKAKGGRPAREAVVSIRSQVLSLRRPSHKAGAGPESLSLGVVMAREESCPAGVEPLCWLLYTSEPVSELSEACFVLDCYRVRWVIEDWHKAWKSGCGVETLRQRTGARVELLAVLLGFVAVRLLQLRELASAYPQEACTAVLTEDEWQCLWLSVEKKGVPPVAPPLRWAWESLGRLGGFRDTQRTGRIGWVTLWRGWERLTERLEGFKLAKKLYKSQM